LKALFKYTLLLVLLNVLLIGALYFIFNHGNIIFALNEISFLSIGFSTITILILFIFLMGQDQNKMPDAQTMHTLIAVSLKFILEMVLALVWFILWKKNSLASVFIFFILYLSLSLFSIGVIMKTLKNKTLQNLN